MISQGQQRLTRRQVEREERHLEPSRLGHQQRPVSTHSRASKKRLRFVLVTRYVYLPREHSSYLQVPLGLQVQFSQPSNIARLEEKL